MLCNNGVAGPHNLFISLNVDEDCFEVKGVLKDLGCYEFKLYFLGEDSNAFLTNSSVTSNLPSGL